MDSSRQALQTNGKLFLNLKLVFELLAENRKKFQLIERLNIGNISIYIYIYIYIYYDNKLVSSCSTNQWEAFFKFRNNFLN